MQKPIIEEILKLKDKKALSFHTPGHKSGLAIPSILEQLWPQDIWTFDLTEIDQLDNLHYPQACLQHSAKLVAEFCGAGKSFFLVNGSTVGIEAALLTLASDKKIFIPRNAHQSAYHGAILANAQVISVPVTLDDHLNIPLGLEPQVLEKFILKYPDCKNLLLVSPNYQGISYKTDQNIKLAQKYGLTVILDEAHGSHFLLHDAFPVPGLAIGADVVIQSWHKTLSALTQSAVLHLHPDYQGPDPRPQLNLLQTTSPSYLLLTSLEASRLYLEEAQPRMEKIIDDIFNFRHALGDLSNLKIGLEIDQPQDPLKLCLVSHKASGNQLAQWLRDQYAIYAELSSESYVLLLLGLTNYQYSLQQLQQALQRIDIALETYPARVLPKLKRRYLPYQQHMDIRKAFFAPKESISSKEALGRIAGQFVVQYPPGIPSLLPGEIITEQIIKEIGESLIQVIRE